MESRPVGPQQVQVLGIPGIVVAAFSVELGFKALILQSDGTAVGHRLDELFSRLSPTMQGALASRVGVERPQFEASLALVSNAFIQWRYIYEATGTVQLDLNFLRKLAEATQHVLG